MGFTWATLWAGTAAAAMIVGSTIVEGLWTRRWDPQRAAQQQARVAALARVPALIGDWQRDDDADAALSGPGPAWLTYRKFRSPRPAWVCVVAGDPLAVRAHAPADGFPRASLRLEGQPEQFVLETADAATELTTAVFYCEEPTSRRRLRLFWSAWAGETWKVPRSDAGWTAGPSPTAKLYLAMEEPLDQPADASALLDLARGLLPELTALLNAGG